MQDYAFNQLKPRRTFPVKLFLLVFLLILVLGFWKRGAKVDQQIISPLPETIISFFSEKPKEPNLLLQKIKELTPPAGGSWAFYVYDLNKNQGFGYNENIIFTAASVNKIYILASLYYLADKGEIDLDQQVTLQAQDIQDYGTGSIRYDPPGTTYSLKTLARLMMEKSDNTAAFLLGRQIIGFAKVQDLVNSWGLIQTDMENNKSSLLDLAKIFAKIYRGQIANQALTKEMIGFLDESDFEDRIPRLLPKEVKVYHKTGDEVGNIHDAGIINLTDKPYFLGVLSSDVTDETTAKKVISQISKMVFEFMR